MTNEQVSKGSFFGRLRAGLSRSAGNLGQRLTNLFTKASLNATTLAELEEALIATDLGVATAKAVCADIARGKFDKGIDTLAVKKILAAHIEAILSPLAKPLLLDSVRTPNTILVVGVNGTGKTTTIAKLAKQFRDQGKSVLLAAGDTFRAAAVEQLSVWGKRLDISVVTTKVGGDAAGLAFAALERAQAEHYDVLLIDTAGRLQNKSDLMAELAKLRRVLAKLDPDAPHEVLLVLDATTGQNALNQIEIFRDIAGVTGLVMTKLDGTARGGILVAAAEKFALPIFAIGVGEQIDDLRSFDAHDFACALTGLESDA